MYGEHFGLKEMPFSIAPDPRYLYLSEQHREALAHLVYGINSEGGFVLITGDVGTGKTTVCRCLLEQLPEHTETAFILNPKLSARELLATICDEFGIPYPDGNASIKVFTDLINAYLLGANAKGHKAVLIIDEAQNLSPGVLEQLRLLTNLETNRQKLLQIILLGQPELQSKLSTPELRQLSQRITARYHIGPLNKRDVAGYVVHRLSIAGLKRQVFPISSITELYRLSGGVPRVINILCDRAMLGAYVQGHDQVNRSTLKKAAREVFGNGKISNRKRRSTPVLPAVFFLLVAGTVFMSFEHQYEEKELVERLINVPVQMDTLTWPEGQDIKDSREMAFRSLFTQWGVPYEPLKERPACVHARRHGLECLQGKEGLDGLRKINRPAVLELFNEQKEPYYAALISLTEKTATFIVGDDTRTVDITGLALSWAGSYTALWRVPPGYEGTVAPGMRGPVVQWIEERLALVGGRSPATEGESVYDGSMEEQVKRFQLAQGLVPDGLVGQNTIIQLDVKAGAGAPVLTGKTD